ncbi:SDR family NAD(P)-dependent oxidoreductase [Actinacidiphila rubida]|uniref:Short-chain dehydrogenase n=1 Tax=Actinacidiphila rubida TaxID=310780 RepID=A0A1H8U6N3_9ACTN|nr:SDR family NAD(P)-dependent oxidoreductase [Actinacidiphila rubida]SEO98952.1 Short-chain dehydrogenase [Actinacidiphila rubida]
MANTPSTPPGHGPVPRSVLLTGASGGVGTVAARALADHGFRVFAGVRDPGAYRPPSPQVVPVALDVTDPDAVATAAATVAERTGGALYAVVNNAGVLVQGPLELVPAAELHRQFAVNVYGPALVTQAFLPLLRRGHGRLVNVSAPTARVPAPFFGPIGASKAALQAMSHALRVELAHWGIPVVILEPGAMRTEIFRRAAEAQEQAASSLSEGQTELYAAQLAAIGTAAAAMKAAPPDIMAAAILRSLTAARPRARYTVGPDTRLIGLLSRLPLRTQDRLISGVLGLDKVAPAQGSAK